MIEAKLMWDTYASAWKAEVTAERRAALAASLAADAIYRDPLAECRGQEALEAYMTDFHRQVPGGYFETTWFLAHHGRSIAKWNMMARDGEKIGDGVSYVEYDAAGKLTSISGFFDVPSAS